MKNESFTFIKFVYIYNKDSILFSTDSLSNLIKFNLS